MPLVLLRRGVRASAREFCHLYTPYVSSKTVRSLKPLPTSTCYPRHILSNRIPLDARNIGLWLTYNLSLFSTAGLFLYKANIRNT